MSSPALLTAPLSGILDAWGQLVEAYHGVSRFGGDTAEVYAYLLTASMPGAMRGERDAASAAAMSDLLSLFVERQECAVEVDGQPFRAGDKLPPNGHRWHVRVRP